MFEQLVRSGAIEPRSVMNRLKYLWMSQTMQSVYNTRGLFMATTSQETI
jgi:hypothetical protein